MNTSPGTGPRSGLHHLIVLLRRPKCGAPLALLLGGLLGLLTGCELLQSKTPSAATESPPTSADHTGYALLFDLLGDEKDVAKLRFIKHPRPPVTDLLKEISRVSGEAHKQLEHFGKADRTLNLKDQRLPAGEVIARQAISKTKQKALLSSKGKELEIQLLLTQQEAMSYGAHLAKTTAIGESQPQRQQFLQQLSEQLTQLEQKVVGILTEHYSFPEDISPGRKVSSK
jgi:hypothetical protein